MSRTISLLILFLFTLNSQAWNMQGHQLVAQIAYDNLTPSAKKMCRSYLHPRHKTSTEASFIAASTWPDRIRFRSINWYTAMHYIDTPFSSDGTALPAIDHTNALWAINQSISILSSKKSNTKDKGLALILLIHIVGDLHQPLHAITRVSSQLPEGDMGGNLFLLGENDIADNLHKYWDDGAGLFTGKNNADLIKTKAHGLEKNWSCAAVDTNTDPEQWSKASYNLAVNQVYQLNPKDIPNKQYELNARNTIQKQVLLAGCRLASTLNQISKKNT